MKIRTLSIAVAAAAALVAGAAHTATLELGMDVMQTMEDLNKSLASNVALKESKKALADAEEMDGLFAQVETHFVERGDAANGVELSKKSRVLVQQIVSAVKASDFGAATNAATDLSRTCKTCHTFYKKE